MIGVFDSGLGGLSVLAAIAERLPRANLAYFADTAHVPYGNKDDDFITRRVLAIGRFLVDHGCTLLVLACNTATAAAAAALRDALPGIPVIGIEPGVKPAAAESPKRHIAVLSTESTARSERLARLIREHASGVRVDVLACPGWATKVETLKLDDADFVASIERHLGPVLEAGADRIVLGCTHYTFLTPVLAPMLAGRATLVDVADAVARQCERLAGATAEGEGQLRLLATAHPERLEAALTTLGLHALHARTTGPAAIAAT